MTPTKKLYSTYLFLLLFVLLLWVVPIRSSESSTQQEAITTTLDVCVFFGQTVEGERGFLVCDDAEARFNSALLQWGVDKIGFPISVRYIHDGFVTQAFQKAIMQWRPESQSVALINVFDDLHQAGFDDRLLERYQTPRQFPAGWDGDLSFDEIVSRRQALLDERPALREAYFIADDPFTFYGLPTSAVEDMGNHFAIRLQRAVLQEWKEEVPWAAKGQVTIANGADIAKALGALPASALVPQENEAGLLPIPPPPTPSPAATLPASSSESLFIADANVYAWAPDSRTLAVAGEQGLRVLSMAGTSPEESPLWALTAPVKTLLFSPDNKRLAAGLEDGTVLLWTLASNSPPLVLQDQTEAIISLAFSPDGRLLASGGGVYDWRVERPSLPFKDTEVRLWEVSSGQLLNILDHEQGLIKTLAFTSDGSTVIATTNERTSGRDSFGVSLLAWDLMNGELQYKHSLISPPTVLSHQKQLAITTEQYSRIIKVWQLPTLAEVNTLVQSEDNPSTYVYNMKLNQSGTILGAGVGEHGYGIDYVKLWEVATGNELATLPIDYSFAIHPTESVAIGSLRGELTVWDITQGNEIGSEVSERQVEVLSLSFSPDGGNVTILFEDNTLQLRSNWEIPTK